MRRRVGSLYPESHNCRRSLHARLSLISPLRWLGLLFRRAATEKHPPSSLERPPPPDQEFQFFRLPLSASFVFVYYFFSKVRSVRSRSNSFCQKRIFTWNIVCPLVQPHFDEQPFDLLPSIPLSCSTCSFVTSVIIKVNRCSISVELNYRVRAREPVGWNLWEWRRNECIKVSLCIIYCIVSFKLMEILIRGF